MAEGKNFLPEISRKNIPLAKPFGKWFDFLQQGKNLNQLADDIVSKEEIEKHYTIAAIPTVWAHPLLFEIALFDVNHPSHKSVLNEWKGLMGVLCFADLFDFSMDQKSIDLENTSNPFLKVVDLLRIKKKWAKAEINLLYIKHNHSEFLLGSLSPMTLVVTPIKSKIPNCVPWIDESGRLCDPLSLDPETKDYIYCPKSYPSLLKGWLNKLLINIKQTQDELREKAFNVSGISNILQKWIDQIKENAEIISSSDSVKYPDFYSKFMLGPIKGEKYLTPRKVFTDILLGVPVEKSKQVISESRIGAQFLHIDDKDFIIPIKSEFFLEDYKIEELNGRSKGDGIEVKVTINDLKNKKNTTLIKFFENKYIIKRSFSPLLTLWPNFKANNWKNYFLMLADDEHVNVEEKERQLTVKFAGKSNLMLWTRKELNRNYFLWILNECPEMLTLADTETDQTYGTIPLQLDDLKDAQQGALNVAVDFGTTSTNIFYRDAQQTDIPSQKLQFNSYILEILQHGERDDIYPVEFFLPFETNKPIIPPIPTHLLTKSSSSQDIASSAKIYVMRDSVIPQFEVSFFSDDEQNEFINNQLKTSLKWERVGDDTAHFCALYLSQIAMQIAAEARFRKLKKVNIKWSYPTAFEAKRLIYFKNIWTIDVPEAIHNCGLDCVIDINDGCPESEATGYYFHDIQGFGAPYSAFVCADIGGGTSDISVWHLVEENSEGKVKPLHQTSIRLAGKEMFDSLINGSVELKSKFLGFLGMQIDSLATKMFLKRPEVLMGKLLKEHGENIYRYIARGGGMVDREINHLKSALLFGFSGILYHIGQICRMGDIINHNPYSAINIYWGGNGSRLINFIFADEEMSRIKLSKFVKRGYKNEDVIVNFIFSQHPKEEVCRGLLSEKNIKLEQPRPDPEKSDVEIILGEKNFRVNGKDKDIIDTFWSNEWMKLDFPKATTELKLFYDLYHEIAEGENISTIVEFNESIALQAMGQARAANYKVKESPFVLGVARLLKNFVK